MLLDNLTYLRDFLTAALGPLGPLIAIGAVGILMIVITLPILLRKEEDPFEKITGARGRKRRSKDKKDQEQPNKLRTDTSISLDRFSDYLAPKDDKELSSARLRMIRAGYRSRSALNIYNFARLVLGLVFLMIGLLYTLLQGGELTAATAAIYVALPGFFGYYLPNYWVERRVQTRQEEITSGFPDSLDLMLVCVEAGQSLDQGILRVSEETKASYPTLAEEFEIVASEMRAGKDRVSVLRDMGERCGVSDISSFVTVLIQSAKFGTSIADALRVYASEMRDKRVMRAEEKANKLPTQLTLGTMVFTVPPLLIILVGPSVYEIYVALGGGG